MGRLDNIKTGLQPRPHRLLVWGPSGVGKSTFASQSPAPIFFAVEDGAGELPVARMPDIATFDDVLAGLDELATAAHPFKTVVLDGLDHLEGMCWAHVCKKNRVANLEAIPYGKGHMFAIDAYRQLLAKLDLLRDKGIGTILLAHSTIKLFNNPEGDGYDRYELAINAKAASLFSGWVDGLFFARHEAYVSKDEKTKRGKGLATGERIMHTTYGAAFNAKNRWNLPDTLPFSYASYKDARATAAQVSKEESK